MEICYAPHVVAGLRPGHYIYTRRSANQCAPPPAKNGGRGGSGGARSGRPFGRLKQAPPTAAARSTTGRAGRRRQSAAGGANRHRLKTMEWREPAGGRACRRLLRAARHARAQGGAQRNPAAGAQAFAPSHRRQLRQRGRRGRLRRKADECTARRCCRGATGCAHTEEVLTR